MFILRKVVIVIQNSGMLWENSIICSPFYNVCIHKKSKKKDGQQRANTEIDLPQRIYYNH